MADDLNETPAPLSDAEIAEATRRIDFAQRQGTDTPATVNIIRRLLATLAARDARLAALEREVTAGQETIEKLLVRNGEYREIVAAVARGFTLVYSEHHNAMICALCDAAYACDDFGMDSRRDAPGWYEAHITHTADCPVTRARALLATQTPATGAMAGEGGGA